MENKEYTRAELESFLAHSKVLVERAESQIKELDEKEAELKAQEAELDPTAGVEVPEDYVYVLLEANDLQIHNIGEDICYECAEDLSRLGLIRNTAESAWVSARRNIRANRLEALAHSIGGAYEFEFGAARLTDSATRYAVETMIQRSASGKTIAINDFCAIAQ
jgi:hypothetical protein